MRYYFGYHFVLGHVFPLKWMEEKDVGVGPFYEKLQRVELTKLEFEGAPLDTLVVRFPYKDPTLLHQEVNSAILVNTRKGEENGEPQHEGQDGPGSPAETAEAGEADGSPD